MQAEDLYAVLAMAVITGLAMVLAINSAGWLKAFGSWVAIVGIICMIVYTVLALVVS